ncbi:hypothetical protein DFS34DRAFT_591640 [Phlyctochytrium arcticum]|nr:hypothetical protein DFS34DRAFT_591640 [Phlyctochytrium arcticum]
MSDHLQDLNTSLAPPPATSAESSPVSPAGSAALKVKSLLKDIVGGVEDLVMGDHHHTDKQMELDEVKTVDIGPDCIRGINQTTDILPVAGFYQQSKVDATEIKKPTEKHVAAPVQIAAEPPLVDSESKTTELESHIPETKIVDDAPSAAQMDEASTTDAYGNNDSDVGDEATEELSQSLEKLALQTPAEEKSEPLGGLAVEAPADREIGILAPGQENAHTEAPIDVMPEPVTNELETNNGSSVQAESDSAEETKIAAPVEIVSEPVEEVTQPETPLDVALADVAHEAPVDKAIETAAEDSTTHAPVDVASEPIIEETKVDAEPVVAPVQETTTEAPAAESSKSIVEEQKLDGVENSDAASADDTKENTKTIERENDSTTASSAAAPVSNTGVTSTTPPAPSSPIMHPTPPQTPPPKALPAFAAFTPSSRPLSRSLERLVSLAANTPQPSPLARTAAAGSPLPVASITAAVRATNPILDELLYSLNLVQNDDAELVDLDLTDCPVFRVSHGTLLAGALLQNTHLKSLSLRGSGFQTQNAIELAEALRVNKTLEILDLSNNQIAPQGIKALAEALSHNTGLKEIRLHPQKSPAGTDAEQALARALAKNESIIKVGLVIRDVSSRNAVDRSVTRNKEIGK